jgi:hypothetical protein
MIKKISKKQLLKNKTNKLKNGYVGKNQKAKSKINKFMRGGVRGALESRYITIPNNGVPNGDIDKYFQCFWISIRDYLNNYRRLNVTALEIKRLFGLGPETDTEQMDYWETPIHKTAVDTLAILLDLRIEFHYIINNRPFIFDVGSSIPSPQTIVNADGRNIVPIAFTGGHYELIISGPNLEPLVDQEPNDAMTIISETIRSGPSPELLGEPYKPKYFNKNTLKYEPIESFSHSTHKKIQEQAISQDNHMLITYYKEQIEKEEIKIRDIEKGIDTLLNSSKLSSNNKTDSLQIYTTVIEEHQANIREFKDILRKLTKKSNT